MRKIISVLFVVLVFFNYSHSQSVVGKIYTKADADNLYGPVITSVPISASLLLSLTNNTKNYLMFRINNGNLIILDNQRIGLFPGNVSVNSNDEFRYFSVSLIQNIIVNGKAVFASVEIRNNNILTITNGNFTLEVSFPCPPVCPD